MTNQKVFANTGKWNQKQRKEWARRLKADDAGLEVVHRDAAGMDVGNEMHYVAVPADRDANAVQSFGCFTEDLRRMAQWLKQCGNRTVAMQSTGVYWIPVYDMLEAEGLEVYLVNARHTKNLPGRKSDVQESQWLMKLHTYGLLNNSYRPPSQVLVLRAYWRQRAEHVQGAAQSIQGMQKVLTEMNLQLANVISDISGVTGQAIIRAILAGERDPQELAKLRDFRIKASPEQIAKSLEGNWRRELLFLLGQHVEMLDAYQRRIAECDRELEAELKNWAARESGQQNPAAETVAGVERKEPESKARGRKNKKKSTANAPRFDLGSELQRINGVDLTKIDGIHVMAAQTVLSEVGYDLSRWKTEAHFVSWLGLCPNNEISGGRVLKRRTRHVVHPLATALRLAAWGLFRSQSYLGAQYRRLRTRLGAPKAITAMAAKLARLIYRMLKFGEEYVDKGMQYYEQKYRAQQIQFVQKKAAQLGLQVVEYKATA